MFCILIAKYVILRRAQGPDEITKVMKFRQDYLKDWLETLSLFMASDEPKLPIDCMGEKENNFGS